MIKGLNMAKHKGLSFYEKEKKISKGMVREIFSVMFFCFAAILLASVIVISFGLKTSVIGVSMEPALSNGQTVFIDRFIYKLLSPRRGDVIVFFAERQYEFPLLSETGGCAAGRKGADHRGLCLCERRNA